MFRQKEYSPSEVKRTLAPSEVEQWEASAPSELVVRVLMVGEVADEETTGWEEEVAMEALVATWQGEAIGEEVNWCRRHSHSQDTIFLLIADSRLY